MNPDTIANYITLACTVVGALYVTLTVVGRIAPADSKLSKTCVTVAADIRSIWSVLFPTRPLPPTGGDK